MIWILFGCGFVIGLVAGFIGGLWAAGVFK